MPRKIIIDTDPGVDDTMAIFFALRSPELDLIGLTTIFGNVHTTLATENALRLLEIAGRPDIPVAHGADNSLKNNYGGPVAYIHGADGQGDLHLPPPKSKAVDKSAAQFIVDQVMSQPGEVTLVPIGPLTNIALALQLEPRIAQNVQEVVLMGGNALSLGNASPTAEANIFNDPEAADLVFGAGWPITMVGLDVTHQTIMRTDHLDVYSTINNPMAQHVARILPIYRKFYQDRTGEDLIFVHDPSVIAYMIDPSLYRTLKSPIRVETQSISRGKTWPAPQELDKVTSPHWAPWKNRPKVNICIGVDGDKVVELELSRMRG